ncbi:MAG: flagellar basal body-associated FliL family protein [Nitrospinae bacterium]|nr:flagellar basal body-associated FliL family protein [Nitrospinota bacterium]MBL7019043.1 flagellar basal body-associated FliL family protein [Nitrospinaceae bacterium]
MAEDQEKDAELSTDETEELERLLEDAGDEAVAVAGLKGKLQKILANKKILMIIGGVLLVLTLGLGFLFLRGDKEADIIPVEEPVAEEEIKDEEETKIEKVNIYKLEPFFLPLLNEGKETGRFISISANLLLSNRVLDRELDKVLPLMRKSIYNILRRKRPNDFLLKRTKTEERIKQEILTASNALLLSGTGTITDVFFAHFMIK